MKPEYGSHVQELDVILLGGYYGEGKSMRGQGLSTFVIGVKNDYFRTNDPNSETYKDEYLTCGKVGTGYSFEELAELRKRLSEIAVPWDPVRMPPHLAHWQVPKSNRPNVYFPVDKSIVVELKCAELVDSVIFTAGMTCRFPRISRIRYDKPVSDILTISEIIDIKSRLRQQSGLSAQATKDGSSNDLSQEPERAGGRGGRRGGRYARSQDPYSQANSSYSSILGDETGKKHRRGVIANTVDNMFKVNNESVQKKGFIFDNMVFCILDEEFCYSATKSFTKDEV
jgi:hypothetical protein